MIHRAFPKCHYYRLLISSPEQVIQHLEPLFSNHPYTISNISLNTIPEIEAIRPGYAKMVKQYLNNGHVGFCVKENNHLLSMAWLYYNGTNSQRRASYFPLRPGNAWLHSAWTNPMYRGKNLHKLLIYFRARYALKLSHLNARPVFLEVNIDPKNEISLNNYKKCGFKDNGYIYLVHFWRKHFVWKREQK